MTNPQGDFTIGEFKPSIAVPAGYYVTATATDPAGNTSEFGPDVLVNSPGSSSSDELVALADALAGVNSLVATAGSFGVNGDGSGGIAPHQSTIIATVPRASQASDYSAGARIYVISAAPVGAGKDADPVSAVFAEGRLWSWD